MSDQNDQASSKPSRTSKTPSTESEGDNLWDMLGEMDVLLKVDIRVYDKTGQVFQVKGLNTLPHIIDQSMLPEAYRNFEEAFHAAIGRPILGSFRKYISQFVKRDDSFNTLTAPNPSEDQGYLSDS